MHKGVLFSVVAAEINKLLLGQIYADMRFLVTKSSIENEDRGCFYYNCSAGTYHSSLV